MIKYIGKKHLNSNFYRQISLKRESDCIKVRVLLDERLKKALLLELDTKTITEEIDGMEDYEKVKEIVLYFLRNNTVCEIHQIDDKIMISSTSSRKLILQLDDKYQKLLDSIIEKYKNDRIEFIDKCDIDNIYVQTTYFDGNKIVGDNTSYYIGEEIGGNNKGLVLTLFDNKKGISSFDKEFIINYIKELINSSEKIISFYSNQLGAYLGVNGKKIRLPLSLKEEVLVLVLNRNYEIVEMNNKQLKLEGIRI